MGPSQTNPIRYPTVCSHPHPVPYRVSDLFIKTTFITNMPGVKFNNMCVTACSTVCGGVQALMLEAKSLRDLDSRRIGFLVAAILCLVIPFETTHLLSAIVGVVAYLLLQPRNIQRNVASV